MAIKFANCTSCQTHFKYDGSKQHGKFCSLKCVSDYGFKTRTISRVEQGLVSDRRTLKRYLIHARGEVCSSCNIGPVWNNKPLSLQVDHIDGNSDINFPSNLRLLCPNCHSQEPTTTGRCRKENTRNVYLREYKRNNSVRK